MLVLNRRPGESIIIQPDMRVTVLSVADRRVWIGVHAPGSVPEIRVSATVISANEARLELGPLRSVDFEGTVVRVTPGATTHPSVEARADLAINRSVGQRIEVGMDAWVEVTSLSKGNPTIAFGGPAVGEQVAITLIRPAGNYVRIGVDAPYRKVYREELWAAVQASELGVSASGSDGSDAPVAVPTEAAAKTPVETAAG